MTAVLDDVVEPNDPTRSGSPLPSGDGARLSRNEIEQLCLKAARGAGMSWGLAEEAGFAAAWLATRGMDGPGALLAQLRDASGRPWREICPVVTPGSFRASDGGNLCPIALGAALCDYAGLPETAIEKTALRVGPINHPILLLPFLSELARSRDEAVRIEWSRGTVAVSADGRVSGDGRALTEEKTLEAHIAADKTQSDPGPDALEPLFVPSGDLRALNEFALRTTVPASEASRAGAGASAGDND